MPTAQAPIGSGFGATSTAEEVIRGIDLSGRTAIVTGGYSGIGLETTRILSAAGATVIVPARTPDKARVNLAGLPRVELGALDLQDPTSIDTFARTFLAGGRPLHLLINSAGVMAAPLTRDHRGYESQFATNHLGHFQLTLQLLPALVQAGRARVIALSSRCPPVGTATPRSISRIPSSNVDPTTSGRPTASPRPPTPCSRWNSTGGPQAAACVPSPSIRAAS